MKRTFTFAAALALGAAALLPLPSIAQPGVDVFANTAPPAPRYENMPPARSGQVWVPGYWNWEGDRHVWMDGHWEADRRGYRYQRPEWARDNDGWRLDRGGWRQEAAARSAVHAATQTALRLRDQSAYESEMIRMAPPPVRYERMPRSRSGHVWVPGYWTWRGNRHEWIRGAWVRERQGYMYSQPRWIERDGQWYMEQGRWVNARRGNGRDRDGDGYRNENDRYPDNPNRR